MAKPLTLYVPLENRGAHGERARQIATSLAEGFTPMGALVLADSTVVHYARWALVPGPSGQPAGLLLITAYDGEWDEYAHFFFERLKPAFETLSQAARAEDAPPRDAHGELVFEAFSKWVKDHNLSEREPTPGKVPFFEAYPSTVQEIQAQSRQALLHGGIQPGLSLSDNLHIALHGPDSGEGPKQLSAEELAQLAAVSKARGVPLQDQRDAEIAAARFGRSPNGQALHKLRTEALATSSGSAPPAPVNRLPSITWVDPQPDDAEIESLAQRMLDMRRAVHGDEPAARAFHQVDQLAGMGTFTLRDDIPSFLREGPFAAAGRRYEAAVRFSNAFSVWQPDTAPDLRGLAFRFETNDGAADVLTTNAPASFARDAVQFVNFAEVVPELLTVDPAARLELLMQRLTARLGDVEAARIHRTLVAGGKHVVDSLATEPYWGSTVQLGHHVIRHVFWPERGVQPGEPSNDPRKLSIDLQKRDVVRMYLGVHAYVNEMHTPIADASVLWSRAISPIIPIGVLEITNTHPSDEDRAAINALDFNPAHGFAPVGITRAREAVYRKAAELRKKLSHG